jgi:hypothetical protein
LETIRQYGEERLVECGETEAMRARHAGYYAEFATEVTRHIFGPGQLEWGARLACERDNLHAAMVYALDTMNVDLAFGLFCELPIGPWQINELVIFDPAPLLALAGAGGQPGYALALVAAGGVAWHRGGDPELALRLCDQALAAEQRLGPISGGGSDTTRP